MALLVIVYVPQLEKVVLVKGYSPVQVSKKQEKKLISKEVAISTAMLDKGIEDVSKFKIKSIELVYSTRAVQFEADEPSMNHVGKLTILILKWQRMMKEVYGLMLLQDL